MRDVCVRVRACVFVQGADHDKIQENRDRLKARLFDAERNMELLDSRLTSAKENFEKRKEAAEASSGASRGVERAAGSGSGFKEDLDRKAAEVNGTLLATHALPRRPCAFHVANGPYVLLCQCAHLECVAFSVQTMLEGAEDGHYIIRRSNTRISDPYTLTMR
jgi:hypothetical protein